MQFVDVRRLLDEIVDDELRLVGSPRAFRFVRLDRTEVYRLQVGSRSYVAHVSSGSKTYLKQLRENLDRLSDLNDPRIPRVLAWRSSNGGVLPAYEWAVLVHDDFEGRPLSAANLSGSVWSGLADLLQRLYELDGDPVRSTAPVFSYDNISGFGEFGRALLLRIAHLPLQVEGVAAQLEQMDAYVRKNVSSFRIQPRLIHGDLDRSNIIVGAKGLGVLGWGAMRTGDYAFDLALLRFVLDSVAPKAAHGLLAGLAKRYRYTFADHSLESRLQFYLPLAGLVRAYEAAGETGVEPEQRARFVWYRCRYAESQWRRRLSAETHRVLTPAADASRWMTRVLEPA